jgi:hypothetical protein
VSQILLYILISTDPDYTLYILKSHCQGHCAA